MPEKFYLIDIYSGGKIIRHETVKGDKCYAVFNDMIQCVNKTVFSGCEEKMKKWDKCIKKIYKEKNNS